MFHQKLNPNTYFFIDIVIFDKKIYKKLCYIQQLVNLATLIYCYSQKKSKITKNLATVAEKKLLKQKNGLYGRKLHSLRFLELLSKKP